MDVIERLHVCAARWRARAETEQHLRMRAECLCTAEIFEKAAADRARQIEPDEEGAWTAT